MSYRTVEVELENGHVRPVGEEALPAKARALLTVLAPLSEAAEASARSLGDAMRDLGITGRGEFADLSTNKRHLDDFGR